MRILKLLSLTIAALTVFSSSLLNADDFRTGIEAYETKQYPKAIDYFKESIEANGETAAARHNLALAYIQSNQAAEALWQIERAHRLNPTNKELIAKAQWLKQEMGLLAESESLYVLASRVLSFAQWLTLAVFLFWVLMALHLLVQSKSTGLRVSRIALWLVCINAISLAYLSYLDMQSGRIISSDAVEIRSAPASAAPAIANSLPGSQGRIIDAHENFYRIKTKNDLIGWISKDNFRPYYSTSGQETELNRID